MAAQAASNAYLVVPEEGGTMRAGDLVTVWLD
jgi:molybdopterin biosynthesis enzyme